MRSWQNSSSRLAQLSAVAVLASAVFLIRTPATVLASCNPNRLPSAGQRAAYVYNNVGATIGGIYGDIVTYPHPYLYGSTADTTVEAQELRGFESGGPYYVQTGWIESNSTGSLARPFFDWVSPYGSNLGVYDYTIAWGSLISDKILYNNPSSGDWRIITDGNEYPANGEGVNLGFYPTDGRVEGITQNAASQMPGGWEPSYHAIFEDTHLYFYGGWNYFEGSAGTANNSWYAAGTDSGTEEFVYDHNCPY